MKGDHSVAVTSSAKTYRLSYKWDSDFYDEAELPPAEEHKYGETISLSDIDVYKRQALALRGLASIFSSPIMITPVVTLVTNMIARIGPCVNV